MLWCLISRGKIIFKPHKWWCFWKKKTNKNENPPLLNLKISIWACLLFVFYTHRLEAYYLWNYFSFQRSFETLLHLGFLINSPASTERNSCVCDWETEKDKLWGRGRESESTFVNYTAWTPAKPRGGFPVTYKETLWAWVFPPCISL